jgi:putative ABC transport system permease protein
MVKNYFISFWRNFTRNSFYAMINMVGLIMGMTTFLLLLQYVLFEHSYDNFLDHSDRIFRIQQDRYNNGELTTQWASGCAGIGPALIANFPEVEKYVRMRRENAIFTVEGQSFREEDIYYAGSDFFKIFSIPLTRGIDTLALKEPFSIVLSQSMARKYFHDQDPVGSMITVNQDLELKVTGIFVDLPENTHMKFDALISFTTYESFFNNPSALDTWSWDAFMTYILLKENTDPKSFEDKLPGFVEKEHGEDLRSTNEGIAFHLQPVRDIHLDSHYMFEFQPNGNRSTVRYLMIIAILVIVIAWINYINLSTARSVDRAREVGIRKIMGGQRRELVRQFMLESLIMNLLAVMIAVLLLLILTPVFNRLSGRVIHYFLFYQPGFWLGLILLVILGTLLSGLYPAFVLSSHQPIGIFSGKLKHSVQGILMRKGLVTLQFIVSIGLIAGTFIIYRQVHFLQNQSLGVNILQTLVLKSPGIADSTYQEKYRVYKNRLQNYAEVTSVSASTEIPGAQPLWNAGGIRRLSQAEDESNQYRVIMMDEDFIPSYGLKVIAGRAFSGEMSHEERNVMMNEAACRLMGFALPEDAINDEIYFWGDTFRIVGVVKNYAQESFKKAFDPMIFRYGQAPGGYYSVKFSTSDVRSSMTRFENDWKEIFPGNPFNYFFLDEHYDAQYKADKQFGKIFGIFSFLAILIACLGLIGLSSLSASQRTKEIGIRKVLGAGELQIIRLLSQEYLILLSVAVLLAIPVTFWAMNRWLQNFATRIDLSWWMFAIAILVVMMIAFLAISYNTLRAAATNPAKTLRYE